MVNNIPTEWGLSVVTAHDLQWHLMEWRFKRCILVSSQWYVLCAARLEQFGITLDEHRIVIYAFGVNKRESGQVIYTSLTETFVLCNYDPIEDRLPFNETDMSVVSQWIEEQVRESHD
jgi:hypothetical protein